ncbi:hypothetical protein BH23BAC1_BH23BAC1_23630 [soil metagenome]
MKENSLSLELAVEIAELGIFKVDLIKDQAVYSQPIMEWFGLNQQHLSLPEIFTNIYPKDQSLVTDTIQKSIASDGRHDLVYRIKDPKTGGLKYLRSRGQVLYAEEKPVAISGIVQDVTNQVNSKKTLEEREKTFRNLIKQAPVALAVFRGTDFIADIVNDAYLSIIGKAREEFIGKPLFESLPEIRNILEPVAREVVRTGKPFHAREFELKLHRNGKDEVCWFNFIWEPYYDDGKIDGFIVVANEVSDQVIARKKIEESEERFRSLIAAAPVAIGLFMGRDLIIENPNQAFIDIVGKGDSVIGKPLREAMPELITEGQPFLQILDDVFTTGKMYQTFGTQVKIVRNGVLNYDYYDITYTPLFNAEGEVHAILDIAIDVTQQVHDHQMIEESEERYRTLIEEASVATSLYMGRDLQIRYANDIMLGYWSKDKSVLGKPLSEAVQELKGQPFLKYLDKVYTTGETYEGIEEPAELWIDGIPQISFFSFTYKALRDNEGKVYGIHHIALDVTGEVLVKRALKESKDRSQAAVEAIEGILWTNNARGEMAGEQPGWAAMTGQTYRGVWLGKSSAS